MNFRARICTSLLVVLLPLICAATSHAQKLPHSCARPDEAVIKHLHLDLKVDFEAKKLSGSAMLTIERPQADAKQLRLDTRGLDVTKVATSSEELKWKLGEDNSQLGRSLTIELPAKNDPTDNQIKIEYSSRPSAEALQWLTPAQTTDKEHPFLFTQSQAILARTWVPCQDTPAVRMTYSAKIQVPTELMAVMSASNPVSYTHLTLPTIYSV